MTSPQAGAPTLKAKVLALKVPGPGKDSIQSCSNIGVTLWKGADISGVFIVVDNFLVIKTTERRKLSNGSYYPKGRSPKHHDEGKMDGVWRTSLIAVGWA